MLSQPEGFIKFGFLFAVLETNFCRGGMPEFWH